MRTSLCAWRGYVSGLVLAAAAIVGAHDASAATITVQGSWTGTPFSNSAYVTMTVEFDPEGYSFDLGPQGSFAHNWWYDAFSNMTVIVTGSVTPQFNGTFYTNSMNWVRIYSNLATPTEALTTPGAAYADLGATTGSGL
ncbi:MAG: hypothetical protein WD042_01865 [Phycisphaeraceae bacterium]